MLDPELLQKLVKSIAIQEVLSPGLIPKDLDFKVVRLEEHNASLAWVQISVGSKKLKQFILKSPKDDPRNQEELNMWQNFPKEIQVYEKVLDDFISFQLKCEEEIWTPWPKYFGGLSDGTFNYIAMEDLGESGYKGSISPGGFELEESLLVIKTIAQFHALSYGIFKGKSKEILQKYPHLQEYKYLLKHQNIHEPVIRAAFFSKADKLRQANYESEAIAIENLFTPSFYSTLCSWLEPLENNPVIVHGDLWKENIFFKYNSSNELVGLKFIDFGFSRVGRRCLDLAYFLFTSVATTVLESYEKHLLETYFTEFRNSLVQKYVANVDELTNFEELYQEYNDLRLYGITVGIFFAGLHTHSSTLNELSDQGEVERLQYLVREHIPKISSLN